jgi:hypothetical protein
VPVSALSLAASGVRGMDREYTITRTMNAWPVVRVGDWSVLINVSYWPIADIPTALANVRFWG